MSPGPLLKDTLKLRLLRYFGRREWIRYGVRFAVLRRFWDPYTPRVQTFELGFFDQIATINPHNKVLGVFSSSSYQLIDFDFARPGSGLNILLRPAGDD
mgnify:CR=1 FL=1